MSNYTRNLRHREEQVRSIQMVCRLLLSLGMYIFAFCLEKNSVFFFFFDFSFIFSFLIFPVST